MASGLADAHIHLFSRGFDGRYGRPSSGGDDVAVYESLRDEHGIERALVVGYEGNRRYAGNNTYVAELARTRPWIAAAAYLPTWPPPSASDLDTLSDQGFAGVVLYVSTPEIADQVRQWPTETLERIGRSFRVVSFNAPAALTGALREVVAALAPCTVMFSHLGLPGRFPSPPSRAAVRERLRPLFELASLAHVGVKVSGLYAASEPLHSYPHGAAEPIIDELAQHFGASRLFWGSDYSPALDWVSFVQTVDVRLPDDLTDAERDSVMGGNLLRVLA